MIFLFYFIFFTRDKNMTSLSPFVFKRFQETILQNAYSKEHIKVGYQVL